MNAGIVFNPTGTRPGRAFFEAGGGTGTSIRGESPAADTDGEPRSCITSFDGRREDMGLFLQSKVARIWCASGLGRRITGRWGGWPSLLFLYSALTHPKPSAYQRRVLHAKAKRIFLALRAAVGWIMEVPTSYLRVPEGSCFC